MKIAVVTPGRFHSFDMAAELEARGCLARIFTGYPRFKIKDSRVPADKVESVWLFQTAAMALQRIPPRAVFAPAAAVLGAASNLALNFTASRRIDDCDGLIALSGNGWIAGPAIQRRGGFWVCDRGSAHVVAQDQILQREARVLGIEPRPQRRTVIQAETREYAQADAIFLPSRFALDSFLEQSVAAEKLKLVPYGIDTARFAPCAPRAPRFTCLFAGQLSYQKGLHYLLKAWARCAPPWAELRLAGSCSDHFQAMTDWAGGLPSNAALLGHLPLERLAFEMSRAHVLVLPSVQDGFGLVMAQAMACGTPVIATAHTGAESFFTDGVEGFIGPAGSVDFLCEALGRFVADPDLSLAMGEAALARARGFGGQRAYGDRVMAALHEIAAAPRRTRSC